MALTFLQLLIYIITFVGIRYTWYIYYTSLFYLYPLLQVIFSIKKGGKKYHDHMDDFSGRIGRG